MIYCMNIIENGIYRTNGSSTEMHKIFPSHDTLGGGVIFLERILTLSTVLHLMKLP